MVIDLAGKGAIVAGGAGAIGLAISKVLAEAGASVTVFDINLEPLAGSPQLAGREVDLADVEAIRSGVDECGAALDILVHVAGVNLHKPFAETTEADWNLVMAVNLRSCFFLAQAALPHMEKRGGGAVILVSSCSAKLGYPGLTDYAASKGGIEAMVRSLACDMAPANVRVNAIAPGTTKTPMTEGLWGDPAKRAAHEATIPLKRLADVNDQAMATLFLASDLSAYITGAVLPVDGGLTAMQQDFIDLELRGW